MSTATRNLASSLAAQIGLKNTDKAVLKAIAFKLDNENAAGFVSWGYIMEVTSKSRSTVADSLKRLRDMKLIASVRSSTRHCVFRLTWEWAKDAVERAKDRVKNFYLSVRKSDVTSPKTGRDKSENRTQRPYLDNGLNLLHNHTEPEPPEPEEESAIAEEVDQGGGEILTTTVDWDAERESLIRIYWVYFWQQYPRKNRKKMAQVIFTRHFQNLTLEEMQELAKTLETDLYRRMNHFGEWGNREIDFIPNAETYIAERQWEDEPQNNQRMAEFQSMTGQVIGAA